MLQKFQSRKFILTVVAMIYTVAASLGYDIPLEKIAVMDAVVAIYVLIEGIADIKSR